MNESVEQKQNNPFVTDSCEWARAFRSPGLGTVHYTHVTNVTSATTLLWSSCFFGEKMNLESWAQLSVTGTDVAQIPCGQMRLSGSPISNSVLSELCPRQILPLGQDIEFAFIPWNKYLSAQWQSSGDLVKRGSGACCAAKLSQSASGHFPVLPAPGLPGTSASWVLGPSYILSFSLQGLALVSCLLQLVSSQPLIQSYLLSSCQYNRHHSWYWS